MKQWKLTTDNINYLNSFSFHVWGVYLLIGSLIAIAMIYTFLIYNGYVQKHKAWIPIALLWFIYTFTGLLAIPTHLIIFRFWMLFAFALSIIAGYGIISLLGLTKKVGIPKIITAILILSLIFYTSGIQRFTVNTAQWPPGAFWTSGEEISGYVWMRGSLPPNTPVFTFVNNGAVTGMDMFICHWCQDVKDFQKTGFNATSDETYNFLKSRNYEYFLVDGQTARKFGANETNVKLHDIISTGRFSPIFQNAGFIILKVA